MESLGQHEITRISKALVQAVHRAASLVDAEDFGGELRGLIRHARELHEILLREQMRSDDSWVVDELRTVCDEMGASLDQFESLIAE
jgi:5-deoxy-D-glucuronate isomerase